MSHTIENRHERIADAATDKADDLSSRLNILTELVKLAAFAVEARRVLSGIHEAKSSRPEFEKVITNAVPASNTWLTMDDGAKKIMTDGATPTAEIHTGFTDGVYR